MRLFSSLLTMVMGWAEHRHASYYLAGLSFAESSFFPIPPDVMLAPMTLAKPERAWQFAHACLGVGWRGGLPDRHVCV
jgi:membrane protein YqaA with SNARE-associated domain